MSAPRPRRARKPRRNRQLIVEQLEARNLLSAAPSPAPEFLIDPTTYDSSHVLVKLRDGESAADLTGSGLASAATDLGGGLYQVELGKDVSVTQAVASFQDDANVLFAQPDYRIYLDATPSDYTNYNLWGLNQINAPAAWNVTTGSSSVIVGVIDTGIDYNHPDLKNNIWTNPNPTVGDLHGYDFANNDGDPMDDNGHGTHVAGIIGAMANNGGVVGVNWNVKLMALKFLNSNGSGYTSDAVRAIDYAWQHGAQILNNSWGGGGYDPALYDAIGRAQAHGVIFVAAAGNSGQNNDVTPNYPSNYSLDNVVSVAASDQNDHRASFSDYGPNTVDLYAPGVGIVSTWVGGGYRSLSGTSMATPFVTGALALLKAEHPDWDYHQLINQLKNTVTKDPSNSDYNLVAWGGRLNLGALVGNAPPADTTPPTVLSATPSGPAAGQVNQMTFTFSEPVRTLGTINIKSFTSPSGANLGGQIQRVTGSGTTWTVLFANQTAVAGTYHLVLTGVTDLAGNRMAQDYTASFTVGGSFTFTSTDMNAPILDFHATKSYLTVNQDLTIKDISVTVNINHTWDGDLRIYLVGPSGTKVLLDNRSGGGGHNFTSTVFSDTASLAIGQGRAPFSGSFRPEKPLFAFNGQDARGKWYLQVEDWGAGDTGTLLSWSIRIDGSPVSGTATAKSGALVGKKDVADEGATPAEASAVQESMSPVATTPTLWRALGVRQDGPVPAGIVQGMFTTLAADTPPTAVALDRQAVDGTFIAGISSWENNFPSLRNSPARSNRSMAVAPWANSLTLE